MFTNFVTFLLTFCFLIFFLSLQPPRVIDDSAVAYHQKWHGNVETERTLQTHWKFGTASTEKGKHPGFFMPKGIFPIPSNESHNFFIFF